jgi:soluble lytic murein transglycosylase-like protein
MRNEPNLQPLGPERMQQRISELRARMSQTFNKSAEFKMPEEAPSGGLQGGIGNSGTLAPFSPTGPGVDIQGAKAPFDIKSMIQKAAVEHGLEPALLDALVAAESAYDPSARSRVGAMGLTQLMPSTAASLGVKNPMDPAENLDGGAKYLSQLLKKFPDPRMALAAYNAGPGAVMRAGGIPNYAETRGYVDKVMAMYEQKRSQ